MERLTRADTGLDASLMDKFTRGYVECALWLADENPGSGVWRGFQKMLRKLSAEAYAALRADAEAFQRANAALLDNAYKIPFYTPERAGGDFWLTRNRHGSGFYDRGELKDIGDKLAEAAHTFSECSLYEGDDGKLYVC